MNKRVKSIIFSLIETILFVTIIVLDNYIAEAIVLAILSTMLFIEGFMIGVE